MLGDGHSHVDSEMMLVVAVIGFIANAISAVYLHRSEHITTRSAYLHVLTDLMSSFGVIVAAVVIDLTGWEMIDPLISIAIAIMITRGAIRVIRESSIILMESAPAEISPVVDIHIWQLGMHENSASLHVVSDGPTDDVVATVRAALHKQFGLSHVTVQVESSSSIEKGACGSC
jgi:cobalt-zinc-cadmium efflux system protein